MNKQAVDVGTTTGKRETESQEPFTRAVEFLLESEPELREGLRSLVLEHVDQLDPSGTPRFLEELLRERCEAHAGLDVNENDLLAPLARELLLHAFSGVNWGSLAERLAERPIKEPDDLGSVQRLGALDRRDGG